MAKTIVKLVNTAKTPAGSNGRAQEPFDLMEFSDRVVDDLYRATRSGEIREQSELVLDLRAKLALEERKLELMVRPLRQAAELLKPESISVLAKQASQVKAWDGALVWVLKKIQIGKKAGAVAWSTLQREGATDAQLLKNLKSICRENFGDARLELKGQVGWIFWYREPQGQVRCEQAITGEKRLLAEVRRVMQIAAPVAKTPAAGKASSNGASSNGSAKRGRPRGSTKKKAKPPAGKKASTKGTVERGMIKTKS